MKLWILLGSLAIALVAAIVAGDDGMVALSGMDAGTFMTFVVGVALATFIGFSALSHYGGRPGAAIRDFTIWVALGAALVLGYSYRDEFRVAAQRITGELMPPGDSQTVDSAGSTEKAVRIRKRSDGHFVARGAINGANLVLLVDTGASTVVLKPTDARSAGIDVDRLNYAVPVRTANGTAYAAAVRLKRIKIGGIVVEGVEALVAKPGALGESLLGMSFLKRLRSYEFSGDFLTLRI